MPSVIMDDDLQRFNLFLWSLQTCQKEVDTQLLHGHEILYNSSAKNDISCCKCILLLRKG